MITQFIEIGNDKWYILIYYNASTKDFDRIADSLWLLGCSDRYINKTLKAIRNKNTGFTFSNSEYKMSIVCISEATSIDQFVSTAVHEMKHVQSHICSYYNVPEKGEQSAYLIGYIAKRMYRMLSKIIRQYV